MAYLGGVPHSVHHVLRAVVVRGPPVQVKLPQPVSSRERPPSQN